MSVPTQRVTDFTIYNDDFYAVPPVTVASPNPVGQFDVAGAAYNQINVKYINAVPMLDAGTVIFPLTEDDAVKSGI